MAELDLSLNLEVNPKLIRVVKAVDELKAAIEEFNAACEAGEEIVINITT
jgi:hypothetical protein